MATVPESSVAEFIGQVIDIFEDFLEEHGVRLDNPEKTDAVADGQDPDGLAIIYGTDYGSLSDDLKSMFTAWDVLQKGGNAHEL